MQLAEPPLLHHLQSTPCTYPFPTFRPIQDQSCPGIRSRSLRQLPYLPTLCSPMRSGTDGSHSISSKLERQLHSFPVYNDFEEQDIMDFSNWKYVDTYAKISSGHSIKTRPGFKRLMADCEASKINLIYTKFISCFVEA